MKVKIKEQNGQTGLRKAGTIVDVNPKTAAHWVKFGWASKITKAKKKHSNKMKDGHSNK